MVRAALFFSFLFSVSAWAEDEAGHVEGKEEKHDVAHFILHHVGNDDKWELENPFDGDKNLTVKLPEIRLSLAAGACEAHPAQPELSGIEDIISMWKALFAGCLDISLTKHSVMMWVALALLLLVFLTASNRNKDRLVPKGTAANLLEMMVLFVRDELAVKNIGKKDAARYTPYLLTIFFFILFMNMLGLIPEMATATGNLAITLGLALCTFVVTQAASIRAAGLGGYLKHLTGGVHWGLWIIMVPVEILGLFTKPFALTVRLFANMLAGHIVIFFLLGLIFIMGSPLVAGVSVPFAMGIYFLELFVALVQAYIFTMLSSLFIGMGVAMGHHEHDHPHEEKAAHQHG